MEDKRIIRATCSYDAGRNLTQCREAAYTTGGIAAYTGGSTYSYATGTEEDGVTPVWKDLLTSYNGNTITYDAIGNPLNWGTSITNMTWNNGRRLTSLKNGASVIQYGYDESGLRTRKYTGTYTVFDRDASGNLVFETRNNGTNHLYYYYDANGSISSISYNGVRYAFRKNLQGDVIAILDTSSNVVARYTYDAWGKSSPSPTPVETPSPVPLISLILTLSGTGVLLRYRNRMVLSQQPLL